MTQWESLGEPASPAEAAALERLKALVTADPIARGWTNVSFADSHGRIAELDAVIVTRVGVFVVELKGWTGEISGTQQTWRVKSKTTGVVRTEKTPLWLTDNKAKRLKSLLADRARNGAERSAVPFIGALVVLHGDPSEILLSDQDAQGLLALDGYNVKWHGDHLVSSFLRTPPTDASPIDGPRGTQIGHLMARAGFVATPRTRMVGQYSLEKADPLGEGTDWQDLLASHPDLPGVKRRIRLFDVPPGASSQQRDDVDAAARREYRFTHGLHNTRIVSPLDFVATESGPALIFEYDEKAIPLDEWMGLYGDQLDLDARLALIRDIGETLRWAHDRRLTHRALTPRQVQVTGEPGKGVRVAIQDWLTGQRMAGTTTATLTQLSRGVASVRDVVEQARWPYLAPEVLRGADDPPAVPLDVYGFGALAYLILTGQTPAKNLDELQRRLESTGGLDPSVASPELPESFAQAVLHATAAHEEARTPSIAQVLDDLEAAYDEATQPVPESKPAIDPVDATKGDILSVNGDERFEVTARRGVGGTGVALEVTDYQTSREGLILKVARDERAARRIDAEAEVLRRLDHRRIVKLVDGPFDVNGRRGVLLSDAGKETLAGRLTTEGKATIEQLERYGTDLLEAVAHLDERGVFHRDIKPANLAIAPDPGTRQPRLTLFDLSLAAEPLTEIESGTPDYLDPYLGTGKRRQFDRAAELYAVAVTLFQMASNTMPWWAEGQSRPAGASDQLAFPPDIFEPVVASDLHAFFRGALSSDLTERPGSVEAMAAAWRGIFARLDLPQGEVDNLTARNAAAEKATLDTPLTVSGLSARALSGLARLRVATVRDLLARNPVEVNSIAGLGEVHRKEIQARIRQWRERLQHQTTTQSLVLDAQPGFGARAVEVITEALLASGKGAGDTKAIRALLCVDGGSGTVWPSLSLVASSSSDDLAAVTTSLADSVGRWRRSKNATAVLDEVVDSVKALGGVATLGEVGAALLRLHGSLERGAARPRRAAGLVRAVVEIDAASESPRLVVRRTSDDDRMGAVLLAKAGDGRDPDAALALAESAGALADALVSDGNPVSLARSRDALAALSGVATLGSERLAQLAADASRSAALSASGELYPVGMDWRRAVGLALVGSAQRSIDIAGIRRRVTDRFPQSGEVPSGSELDEVVAAAVPGMVRRGDRFERGEPSTAGSVTSRPATVVARQSVPEVVNRLRGSLTARSAETLCVPPERYDAAVRDLRHLFPEVAVVDFAASFVRAARVLAAEEQADWTLVLRLDSAAPTSAEGANLRVFLDPAIRDAWAAAVADERPVLLTYAAPLLRYGHNAELASLLDLATPRPAARWLLAPRPSSRLDPRLDGHPIPLGANRWIDLPPDLATAAGVRP